VEVNLPPWFDWREGRKVGRKGRETCSQCIDFLVLSGRVKYGLLLDQLRQASFLYGTNQSREEGRNSRKEGSELMRGSAHTGVREDGGRKGGCRGKVRIGQEKKKEKTQKASGKTNGGGVCVCVGGCVWGGAKDERGGIEAGGGREGGRGENTEGTRGSGAALKGRLKGDTLCIWKNKIGGVYRTGGRTE
jgi:hypothetical protein